LVRKMSFLEKIFKGGTEGKEKQSEAQSANSGEEDVQEPKVHYENIPGTLDLGWYWSENKEEYQMAKIPEEDRATHLYVIGATGTGKTKFLEFLIHQDIEKGNGLGIIDPHGDLVEDIKGFLACRYDEIRDEEEISEKVILIDPTDPEFTVTFNPLEKLPNVSVAEQANELVSAFKKIWSDSWGVRMENLMRNSLIALAEAELTLAEFSYFLTKRAFRRNVLKKVNHPQVQEYFQRFDSLTDRGQVTWVEPVLNKIDAFLSDHRIRLIFSSPKSSFNLRRIMDGKRILLVKLDKGKLKGSADLLGSLLMAKIQMAVFSRSDIPQDKRVPFYLYIDEFQNFASESFAVILSEARKYGLSLIIAHQTLAQIPEELRSLILGNTGIQVYFRLNRQDASLLAKEAFEYSGYQVKTAYLYRFPRIRFWSLAEEWEQYTESLQNLPARVYFAKHKLAGGVIHFQTAEIKPARTELEMDEVEYREFLASLHFGRKYLVAREKLAVLTDQRQELEEAAKKPTPEVKKEKAKLKEPVASEKLAEQAAPAKAELLPEEKSFLEFLSKHPSLFVTKIYEALRLSGYKGDRLKSSLIEKGLIIQQETRKGLRRRLAKILNLTDEGATAVKKLSLPGKGGDLHKQLQDRIAEQAKVFGWKAAIEERIGRSLEHVDVGLRKDDMRVAVEISDTTKPEQEIQNIKKCLEAGYDYILAVGPDDKDLSLLKTEVKKSFTYKERERVRFYPASRVKDFFGSVSPAIVSENGIVSGQITKQKQPRKELLDSEEAAEYLGIKKTTLYEWKAQRKIPFVKVGGFLRFRRTDLEKWLEKRTHKEENFDILNDD